MDLFTFARWLGYAATFALIGAATFQTLLRIRLNRYHPKACSDLFRLTRRVAVMAAWVLLVALGLKLRGQLLSLVDPGEAIPAEMVKAMIVSSAWGHGWMLQACGALLALVTLAIVADTWIILPIAVVIAGLAPLTGHAVENSWGSTAGIVLHGVHQLGGGVWLGTLSLIVLLGYGGTRRVQADERDQLLARLVNAYSPIALGAVGITVLAGLLMAYSYIRTLSAVWTTSYGQTLLVKTGLLVLTAGLGAYNWRMVRPALGSSVASRRLLRSATLELIVGTLLLAATSILVALPAPAMQG
ncbi:MAG: CopD family protein [Gemmatimonadota bacterium]